MANVDLYDASDVFVSTHTTIQAAINAASAGYKVKVGSAGSPYYDQALTMVDNITLMPKAGETVVISNAIGELIEDLGTGLWTLHDTVSGRQVYRYTYTASPFQVQGVRDTDTRLFTYDTYAALTGFALGQGIFLDDAANRLYCILGTGATDPNTVAVSVNSGDFCIDFNGDDGCTVEDLTFEQAGEGVIRFRNSDSNIIQRCTVRFGKHGIWIKDSGNSSNDNIIQDCIVYDTFDTWDWNDVKGSAMEGTGIRQTEAGADNIIRRNEVYGYFNGIVCNHSSSSAPDLDGTLIYENTVHEIRDDAIEIENYVSDLEIFENEIYDAYVGFSATPHYRGPSYFYRNKVTCDRDSNGQGRGFKGSDGQTRTNVKIYHNTFTANGNCLPMGNSTASEITDFEVYNNIFLVQSGEFAISGSPFHTQTGNDYDGNIYYRISGSSNLFRNFDKNDTTQRADLDAFRASAEGIASGWETNGLDDTDGNPHVDLSSYPYPLIITSASSIAIDNGVTLPASFPDRTDYNGDLTIGWQPFSANPGIPVKSSGLVRGASNTATGNQTFRDAQLTTTPNAAMFIITSATADNTATADAVLGIGFATSTTQRVAIAQWDDDAAGTTATRRRSIEDGCIVVITSTGTIVAQADFVQFDADVGAGAGVTINWTNAPESAFLVTVVLFCATNAIVGTYLTPASAGGTVSPSIGFQASVIFTVSEAGAIPDSSAAALLCFGMGGRNLTQRCWATRAANSAANAELNAQFINNRIAARLQSGGSVLNSSELTAVGATDFTITQRDGTGGTDEVGYLALEFTEGNYWIGDVDTPIVTGTQTISTPSFYPQLVIMGLTNTEAANTVYTDNRGAVIGISAFTEYASYSNVIYSDDGADTTASKSLVDDTAINMPNDDGAAQNVAAFVQFTTSGYEINHTAVASTAKKMFAFVLEGPQEAVVEEPAPAAIVAPYRSSAASSALAYFELWLTTDTGQRLAQLSTGLGFQGSKVANGVGWFHYEPPKSFDKSLIRSDRMLQLWYTPRGATLGKLWNVYFVRKWKLRGRGIEYFAGPDINELLRRRIVAAYTNSAQAKKEAMEADDMMKQIVSESQEDTAEPLPTFGSRAWANLTVQADQTLGPQISDSFPFKKLLTFEGGGVLPAIAKAAQVQGTEVFFAIEPNVVTKNSINFIFKTYVGQPGQDVTNKVVFEEAANNLANASLEYDYSDEANYIYATGQGEQANREVEQVYDETRINQSIWGRIEGEADSRDQDSANGVNASGSMALWDGRPKIRFTGTPLDTEHLPFGTAWDFGYKVTTKFDVIQFDSIIRAVTLSLDSNGRKTIDTRLDFES